MEKITCDLGVQVSLRDGRAHEALPDALLPEQLVLVDVDEVVLADLAYGTKMTTASGEVWGVF